ncbi:MAG: hypothetical protein ACI4BC_10625 [Muribaculaceae bacterium]
MEYLIFENTLLNTGDGSKDGYLCHAFCHKGECSFLFNNKEYKMVAGDCLVVRRSDLLLDIHESDDFGVDVVYATPQFTTIATHIYFQNIKK